MRQIFHATADINYYIDMSTYDIIKCPNDSGVANGYPEMFGQIMSKLLKTGFKHIVTPAEDFQIWLATEISLILEHPENMPDNLLIELMGRRKQFNSKIKEYVLNLIEDKTPLLGFKGTVVFYDKEDILHKTTYNLANPVEGMKFYYLKQESFKYFAKFCKSNKLSNSTKLRYIITSMNLENQTLSWLIATLIERGCETQHPKYDLIGSYSKPQFASATGSSEIDFIFMEVNLVRGNRTKEEFISEVREMKDKIVATATQQVIADNNFKKLNIPTSRWKRSKVVLTKDAVLHLTFERKLSEEELQCLS